MTILSWKKRSIEATIFVFVSVVCILSIFPPDLIWLKWGERSTQRFVFLFLGLGMLFFLFGNKRLMVISLAGCAALCLFLNEKTRYPLRMDYAGGGLRIKVAQIDISQMENPLDSALSTITRSRADLISLQKVTHRDIPRIVDYLSCCGYDFYHCPSPNQGFPEMIIFSKYPFAEVKNVYFRDAASIVGKVRISPHYPGQVFYFINSALGLSESPDNDELLRENLSIIASQSGDIKAPLMVFGNYQLAPWSKELNHFQQVTGLKNSRGQTGTISAPINHILYSHHFKCISFETINSIPYRLVGIMGTYELTGNSTPNVKKTSQEL